MRNIGKRVLALLLALALAAGMALAALAQPSFDEKQWFKTGDYDICYRVVPAKGAQVGRIFFIHGFISSSLHWEELAALFSEAGYMCAVIDLPGFGDSTREAGDVTPKDREAIVAELMEELAPGQSWIVAGHSMGGGVALNLATLYPEKVSSLLLYAPASGVSMQSDAMAALTEPLGFVMNVLLTPLLYMTPLVRLLSAAAFGDFCYGMCYDVGRIVDPLKKPGTVKSILYMAQRAMATDMEAIGGLEMPILLMWAENDLIISAQMEKDLTAALPQAQVQTMKGGHMFAEPYARETFEASMEFLEG